MRIAKHLSLLVTSLINSIIKEHSCSIQEEAGSWPSSKVEKFRENVAPLASNFMI